MENQILGEQSMVKSIDDSSENITVVFRTSLARETGGDVTWLVLRIVVSSCKVFG